MDPKYTLWQRFCKPKPDFWKRVQIFGASLTVLGGGLLAVPLIPPVVLTILLTAGPLTAFIAQFAVKPPDPDQNKQV